MQIYSELCWCTDQWWMQNHKELHYFYSVTFCPTVTICVLFARALPSLCRSKLPYLYVVQNQGRLLHPSDLPHHKKWLVSTVTATQLLNSLVHGQEVSCQS